MKLRLLTLAGAAAKRWGVNTVEDNVQKLLLTE